MYVLYLIQHSETKEIYVGITNNLKSRINQHNNGGRKSTTRKTGTWELVYAEAYRNKDDVITREKILKAHGRSIQELKKRISRSLS